MTSVRKVTAGLIVPGVAGVAQIAHGLPKPVVGAFGHVCDSPKNAVGRSGHPRVSSRRLADYRSVTAKVVFALTAYQAKSHVVQPLTALTPSAIT